MPVRATLLRTGTRPPVSIRMIDLTGKLLIAMPGMGDPRFQQSVILMCSHSEDGAMGLIVNKPAKDVTLDDLFKQLEIEVTAPDVRGAVHYGGPVEGSRGFMLHSPDYTSSLQTLDVSAEFSMTATLDILEDMAAGKGPERAMMMLGYSGWGPLQLETEIGQNGWLTADADAELVFDLPHQEKWAAALRSMGVDPMSLSGAAGHA